MGVFDILSFDFLMIFVSKISNLPLNLMEKPKTSIIWKASDCRAKLAREVVQHMLGCDGLFG